MNYDQIIDELNGIINSNLNFESLKELQKIYIYMNRAYNQELLKNRGNKKYCAPVFEKYVNYINNAILTKLKETLFFDDVVIKHIFDYIKMIDKIEDMYIVDDEVIVKYNNASNKSMYALSGTDFIDIQSEKFICDNGKNIDTKFLIMSINNTIKTLIDNHIEPEDKLVMESGKIYMTPGLSIYANRNLNDILADKTGTKITKLLVMFNDMMLCFDMKMRDEYVILSENGDQVVSLSEVLDEVKIKKRK